MKNDYTIEDFRFIHIIKLILLSICFFFSLQINAQVPYAPFEVELISRPIGGTEIVGDPSNIDQQDLEYVLLVGLQDTLNVGEVKFSVGSSAHASDIEEGAIDFQQIEDGGPIESEGLYLYIPLSNVLSSDSLFCDVWVEGVSGAVGPVFTYSTD